MDEEAGLRAHKERSREKGGTSIISNRASKTSYIHERCRLYSKRPSENIESSGK